MRKKNEEKKCSVGYIYDLKNVKSSKKSRNEAIIICYKICFSFIYSI